VLQYRLFAVDNRPPPLLQNMYYVYLLKSLKDEKYYIGYTNDLRRRLTEHNTGQNKSTKHRQPFELVYYEAYSQEASARLRERRLKQFKNAYKELTGRINIVKVVGEGKSEHLLPM
jgi:putative endonuclease